MIRHPKVQLSPHSRWAGIFAMVMAGSILLSGIYVIASETLKGDPYSIVLELVSPPAASTVEQVTTEASDPGPGDASSAGDAKTADDAGPGGSLPTQPTPTRR